MEIVVETIPQSFVKKLNKIVLLQSLLGNYIQKSFGNFIEYRQLLINNNLRPLNLYYYYENNSKAKIYLIGFKLILDIFH